MGTAWTGADGIGKAGLTWTGVARHGGARRGKEGQGSADWDRPGMARRDQAWRGLDWLTRQELEGRGRDTHGKAGP